MSPETKPSSSVYDDGLLSERQGADQIEELQKQILALQEQAESHADERRRDWNRVNTWALAANIALFSVAIVVALGVTTHNFFLWAELREKGERLTVIEERMRQITTPPCVSPTQSKKAAK